MSNDQETRTCAMCGQVKPLSAFDWRFIYKPVKLTCGDCRNPNGREPLWIAGVHMSSEERAQRRREREREQRERMEDERRQREREEQVRQQQEWEARHAKWIQSMAALGYSEQEAILIDRAHAAIELSGYPWEELKRLFLALDPPYGPTHSRFKLAQATRERIYGRQEGRCYYCDHDLLPLDVHGKGYDRLSATARSSTRHWWEDIPELDHKVPISRGGQHTPDNLCYACRDCNQRKSYRTPEEFACMPNDPISRLRVFASAVAFVLRQEAKGYRGFAAGRPVEIRRSPHWWALDTP